MIAGRAFVVFSDDWGRHPSSCQHLFLRLAPANRVLWVNTIGTRLPALTRADLGRAAGKLRTWSRSPAGTAGRDAPVRVLEPIMTPFDRWRPGRRLNRWLLRRALRRAVRGEHLERPILVTTIPNAAGAVGVVGEHLAVYYCVDDFSEWPGADRRAMVEMERDLLKRVDLVIATSETLFEEKSALHPRVRLVRHGVDVDAFRAASGTVPPTLAALQRPLLGATGLVDARIDVDLVAQLARAMPEATFAFVGPRQLPEGPLDRLENVRFLPAVPYADVPATVHSFDVAVLPYVENRLTERINPLKLREYLATGVPIVATPLPEAARFRDVIELARRPEEWVAALRRALGEGRARAEERRARIAPETWEARAEEFSRHLLESEAAVRSTP